MGAGENRAEKLDRELIELLNGLRVVLPGVQVLFAFLVTDVLFGLLATSLVSAAVGGALLWFWYGVPLLRRVSDQRPSTDATS